MVETNINEVSNDDSFIISKENPELKSSNKKFERNITLIYIARCFSGMFFFAPVMILFFQEWGKMSFTQIMILEAIFMASIVLLEIPTGTIADKFGRKVSLNLGILINVLAITIYTSQPSFWIMVLGEIVWALSETLVSGSLDALVYDSLVECGREKESKKIFSRMNSWFLSGMILATLTGALMASIWGVWYTVILTAIPLMISLIIGLFLKEPSSIKSSRNHSLVFIFQKGLKNIKTGTSLKKLIFDSILMLIVAYYSIWLWQPRLSSLHVEIQYFGLVSAGMLGMQVLVLNSSEKLEKLFRSKKTFMGFTGLFMGIGMILAGITSNIFIAIIGLILATGMGMSRKVLSFNYMQKHIESEQRATTLSTISMLQKIVLMALNPLFGIASEINLTGTMIALGIFAILISILIPLKEEHLND